MKETVTTINNVVCLKSDCRLIEKEYYLIGDINVENSGDVYLIDNRYIRISTGRLVFNHSTNTYQLKNDGLCYGIISMDKDNLFNLGYFNKSFNNQFLIDKDHNNYVCINENVINKSFREELSTGNFYHISLLKASKLNSIKGVKKEYKESLPYDSKGIMNSYINNYNDNYNPTITKTIEKYSTILKDLSFGFEFETVKGMIPNNKLHSLPLIPLRDGSISGLEYVTIPLTGKKGIKAIIDCVKELDKRTIYNNDCSLHLHIGNIPRTPEFILALYKIITLCQDEIFSLFPLYKKYNFGVKRKNYSEPFPFHRINYKLDASIDPSNKESVNNNFDVLFNHLSEGIYFKEYKNDLKNVNCHPSDPNGTQKWNIRKRYYAYNFIPLIFGNKETVEFRIHTPTYDIDKIINFLFINSYLINYAIKNQEKILSDPNIFNNTGHSILRDIICDQIQKNVSLSSNDKNLLINYHLNYIEERKRITYIDNCAGNIVGNENNIYCHNSIDWEEENIGSKLYSTPKVKFSFNEEPISLGGKIIRDQKRGLSYKSQSFAANPVEALKGYDSVDESITSRLKEMYLKQNSIVNISAIDKEKLEYGTSTSSISFTDNYKNPFYDQKIEIKDKDTKSEFDDLMEKTRKAISSKIYGKNKSSEEKEDPWLVKF